MVAAAPAPAVREPEPRAAAAREAAPAAVPRAEPSAGAEAARSRRGYWVQVGAFRTIEAARRLAATLRGQEGARGGRSDVLVAAGSPQAPLARVRVGPFPHREEAASKMRALQARGYKAFIASAED
jgi:cell division septation protein DedD